MLGKGAEKFFFEKLAVHLDFLKRVLFTNIWLFKPLLEMLVTSLFKMIINISFIKLFEKAYFKPIK